MRDSGGGPVNTVGGARARRARAEARAERVSGARRRVSVPRTQSPRSRARRRGLQDRHRCRSPGPAADGKAYASDFAVLVRFIDHEEAGREEGEPALRDTASRSRTSSARSTAKYSSIASRSCSPASTRWKRSSTTAPSGKSSVRFSTVEVPKTERRRAPDEQPGARRRAPRRSPRKSGAKRIHSSSTTSSSIRTSPRRSARTARNWGSSSPSIRRPGGRRPGGAELLTGGKPVAQLPVPLAAADASGRIQELGRFRSIRLPPGPTSCSVVVKQGPRSSRARRRSASWSERPQGREFRRKA